MTPLDTKTIMVVDHCIGQGNVFFFAIRLDLSNSKLRFSKGQALGLKDSRLVDLRLTSQSNGKIMTDIVGEIFKNQESQLL